MQMGLRDYKRNLILNYNFSVLKFSIYKGFLFVIVTTGILYILINRFLKKKADQLLKLYQMFYLFLT